MKHSIFLVFLLLISNFCIGQTLANVDLLVEKELNSANVAALAVAVIDSGKIVHLSAGGARDIKKNLKASINTPFHIASISKVVTNLAVFKLIEANKLDLNTDINEYLPFEVKNPHFPNAIITIRELLNHRSGIKDNFKIYKPHWSVPKGDSTLELAVFLKDYLNIKGKLYTKKHYRNGPDVKSFAYSNTGIALLGFIVETVSGMSFEEFCQKNIFQPMAMTNTSWFLKNLSADLVAKTYVNNKAAGLTFKGHNGYPDYPGGQLRTSIADFAKLFSGYLNSANNNFILKGKTTAQITPNPQTAQQGYFSWFISAHSNKLYYTHDGGDTGVRTVIIMDVKNKNSIIIFANTEFSYTNLLRKIEKSMWGSSTN